MDGNFVVNFITYLIPMLLCLTVHEYAHALAAAWLGDGTAASQGRLTLNPLAHIDPIGTLLVPAIGILAHFPFFGWAKPVPTNPVLYRRRFFGQRVNMTLGMAMVAAAGPLSNLLFATLIAAGLGAMNALVTPVEALVPVYLLAIRTMLVNIGLFVFNLIPVPPLDGSRIVYWLLPDRYKPFMDLLSRNSPFVFLGLILLMNTGVLYSFIGVPFVAIIRVLLSVFGIGNLLNYM